MFRNYLKIAYRNLCNNLSYTVINVLGLGLGMAGAVMIFLFLQLHLDTDRHQPYFDRIYRVVLELHLDEGIEYDPGSSVAMAGALSAGYAKIEKVGFIRKVPGATISSKNGKIVKRFIEKENVVFADQGYMEMMAFDWLDNNAAHSMKEPYTVVINEKIALKYFGTANVTGKILRLHNAYDLRIAGVVRNQKYPTDLDFEVYISLPTLKKVEPSYEMENFGWLSSKNRTFVRLIDSGAASQTQKLIKTNGPKYYGETAKYYVHQLQPLSDVHFDERYDGTIRRSILWILAGTGVFLLFIACINFVNLATAQALKRAREIGVRKALGSTRSQLFCQVISETSLLTLGSSIFALVLVATLLPLMNHVIHTSAFHLNMLFQLKLMWFWVGTLPFVVLFAGFYPAVIISGFNPVMALKSKMGTQQIGGIGLRRLLITTQLTIAQILVVGTLVLILQLDFFKNADLGFDKNTVITIPVPKADAGQNVNEALRNELLDNPGIRSVSYQYEAPTSAMGYGGSVRFGNKSEWEKFVIRDRFGDESYLDTYRMPLLAGRNITGRDSVVEFVVNEEFVKKVGIRDPEKVLGKQLEDGNSGLKGEIVGVVKSFHLKSLQSAIEPCVIFARPGLYKEVAIKLDTKDLAATLKTIQKVWLQQYPDEVFSYQFVDEQIAKFYEKEQQLTDLIRVFAMVAIFICSLGLYGMISFMVTQKTKEIGVRKILGARVDSILMLFGKEFIWLIVISFTFATPFSWYFMNAWLSNFAYRIELHWWIFASGGFIILMITMLTVCRKVVKAAWTNPVNSLGMD